jgi:hypothetical protein
MIEGMGLTSEVGELISEVEAEPLKPPSHQALGVIFARSLK